ncbi:MAG: amidohydrolase family protein, partial [Candidatus Cloacimonadaceae bacterium]|nr:amidohydrolase family protein [Candidatus Cloacimonadaceae bacterium]
LIIQAIKNSVNDIYKLGLVAFHSMESEHSKDLLMQSQAEGSLFRCCWHIPLDDLDRMITAGVRSYTGNEFMKTGGVKIFGDGSLGSQTAAMFDHYPSDPANFGILRYDRDELFAIVAKAAKNGISSTIHAIGDRTVRTVIEVIAQTRSLFPEADLMHRIEHVQTIQASDLEKLKACGAYCALQPVHLANDIPMIEQYWQSTRENPYPFKSMVDHGIPHGFGSDAPIETINPFHGIYSALYRKHRLDPAKASWMPHQCIDLMSALEAYTIGAAKASRSERVRGSIHIGRYADLIVLDDWSDQGEEYWLNCRSRLTMINGCIVFSDL